eukprot:TRINITY_DN10358_c0_g2_i2.p1 TRINITY_DN10358_c0_g2~~TRINITY_DN10358_c0_g2_i2.p1  ORF type:complete len:243 (-),score=50.90 TRINITY_DN10358_c0_g2_i2:81-722(-)
MTTCAPMAMGPTVRALAQAHALQELARLDAARLNEVETERDEAREELKIAMKEQAEVLAEIEAIKASARAEGSHRRLAEEEMAEALRERDTAREERDHAMWEKEHADRKLENARTNLASSQSMKNRLHELCSEFEQTNDRYLLVIAGEKERCEEACTQASGYREMLMDARQRCDASNALRVQVERERDELKKENSHLVRERNEAAAKLAEEVD